MTVEAEFYEQADLWGSRAELDPDRSMLRASEVARLLPPDVSSVLDVGTGDGRVLTPLRTMLDPAVAVFALDRSATALRHVGLPSVLASADRLPMADLSVDVVLACELLEHLPPAVYDVARAELGRVARRAVVLTVPNRERLRRSDLLCRACGCRYNRRRHLRRFSADSMADVVPGFRLASTVQFGPRSPVYPRLARQLLEERGVLSVHDAPSCPQCGSRHPASSLASPGGDGAAQGRARTRYRTVRRMVPGGARPYWLAARFDRAGQPFDDR